MTTVQLQNPPTDLISSVKFAPKGPILLTTSWDSTLRIYDARQESGSLYGSLKFKAPLLDSVWDQTRANSTAYVGGLERRVYAVDVERGQTMTVGKDHEMAVKSLVYHSNSRSVISGSLDKTLQQIDLRSFPAESRIATKLPGKVFAMDGTKANLLVVAMSERKQNIYDMRSLETPLYELESSLKYPTRTVKCISRDDKEIGYITTSIEGRVAVDFFDQSEEAQSQKFAFKCHRVTNSEGNGSDLVTPVNGLAMHPNYSTFFTGGSDNGVYLWDYKARKRLRGYPKMPASVMSLDVDQYSGSMLAIGVSDDSYKQDPINLGQKPARSAVFVHYLAEGEAKGKFD